MDDVKFVHVYKMGIQPDFEGRQHAVELPVGEVHISYMESVLCGTDKKKLANKYDTKIIKITKLRPQGFKMCEKCEKTYKENQNLSWVKWVANSTQELHGAKSQESP